MTDNHAPDNETRLERLLRADLPPARDPLFRIAVLERRERQAFRRRVAATVAVGAAAVVLVVGNAATISAWLAEDVTRLAGVFAVAAGAVRTIPGGSNVVRRLVPAWLVRTMGPWLSP